MVLEPQTQIFIVAGVLGIICGILIVVVVVLRLLIVQLTQRVKQLEAKDAEREYIFGASTFGRKNEPVVTDYAFMEPSIKSGEVLSRRGFVMSADQVVPPRLIRTGSGMYGGASRENIEPMGGTKDASNDFIVNPSRLTANTNQLTQNQRNTTSAAPRPESYTNGGFSTNNLQQSSFPNIQRVSQFNNNIMMGSNTHPTSNAVSTEFPSIDYEDVVRPPSTPAHNFFSTDQSRHHY